MSPYISQVRSREIKESYSTHNDQYSQKDRHAAACLSHPCSFHVSLLSAALHIVIVIVFNRLQAAYSIIQIYSISENV